MRAQQQLKQIGWNFRDAAWTVPVAVQMSRSCRAAACVTSVAIHMLIAVQRLRYREGAAWITQAAVRIGLCRSRSVSANQTPNQLRNTRTPFLGSPEPGASDPTANAMHGHGTEPEARTCASSVQGQLGQGAAMRWVLEGLAFRSGLAIDPADRTPR